MALEIRDVMTTDVKTTTTDTPVKEAARIMSEYDVGALPVEDENGEIVGIVTESDLIMQDVRVHFPSYVHLLDGIIYLESMRRFERELKKAVGAVVADVMSGDVITVSPDASVEEVATLMMDKGVGRLPVVDEGRLVGIVSKHDIVRAIAKGE